MSDDKNQSIQMDILDDIMDNITNLYKYCISLEERIGNIEVDMRHNRETFDDMETDIDLLYAMAHSCDNFCGNCAHCKQYPDGLYKCEITAVEIDPDTSSCIRFESPQKKFDSSDAEICKVCSDKDTPRCYKCSHFPF